MRIISSIILLLFCTSLCFAADKDGVIQRTEYILDDVWSDTGNSLNVGLVSGDVTVTPASSFTTGQVTVLIADTAERLSVDSIATREIIISALPNNASAIYVGVTGDTATQLAGYALSNDMAHTVTLPIDNVQDVWITGPTAAEGVSWIGILR